MIDPAYEIQDDHVLAIVAARPEIAALLDEIAARTFAYFPEATGLVNQSKTDPEDGSLGWYVEVRTPGTVEEVTAQFRRFDREWWLAAKPDIEPEFILTLLLV